MAEELIANVEIERTLDLKELVRGLTSTGRYFLVSETNNEIAFSFTRPVRESWPEDFTISRCEESLILSIHSATRNQREQTLKDTETALSALALPTTFKAE